MQDQSTFTYGKPKKTKPAPKAFDYGSVSGDDKKALRSYAAYAQSVARKSTIEIFELGRRLRDARQRLPGRYEDWIKRELMGITVRTAQNYTSVWERFDDRREQIVALGLKPTALYKLATAPEPAVEELLGRAEAGEKVLGADVSRVIRLHAEPDDDSASVSPADQGGPKGLKALLNDSAAHWQREWTARATEHLHDLEALLPPGTTTFTESMAVVEKKLVAKAQWLKVELSRMTGAHFVNPAGDRIGMPLHEGRDWSSEPWKRLYLSLASVGVGGQRKGRLFDHAVELLPRLRWALGKKPLPLALDDSALPPDEDYSPTADEDGE